MTHRTGLKPVINCLEGRCSIIQAIGSQESLGIINLNFNHPSIKMFSFRPTPTYN